jgi:hypothetical protein
MTEPPGFRRLTKKPQERTMNRVLSVISWRTGHQTPPLTEAESETRGPHRGKFRQIDIPFRMHQCGIKNIYI